MGVPVKVSVPKPWQPKAWEKKHAAAFQALCRGDATEHQQQLAMDYLINTVCGTYDMSFRPGGPEGDRETAFAEGMRFVGNQVVKLTKLNLAALDAAAQKKETK